jgi:hypothetical protein
MAFRVSQWPSANWSSHCASSNRQIEAAEQWPAELVRPSVGELHLGLDTGRPDHAAVRRCAREVVQQRRLPDPCLAAKNTNLASTLAQVRHKPIQRLALARSTPQRETRVLAWHLPPTSDSAEEDATGRGDVAPGNLGRSENFRAAVTTPGIAVSNLVTPEITRKVWHHAHDWNPRFVHELPRHGRR